MLRLVAGLVAADTGRITIDGETVAVARSRKAIGLVPQEPALMPWLNVLENVKLPLKLNRKGNRGREARDPVELLGSMGLGDALNRYPWQLSGGMQQRMDLLDFWQTHRKSVLFVTHSVPEAVILSDRIVVMGARPGRIRAVLEVNLPRPRSYSSLDDPAFHRVEHEVRELLREASH